MWSIYSKSFFVKCVAKDEEMYTSNFPYVDFCTENENLNWNVFSVTQKATSSSPTNDFREQIEKANGSSPAKHAATFQNPSDIPRIR